MFYGSVVSTFTTNKIPDNAKLTLIINKLEWQDRDEFEKLEKEALADPERAPFSLDMALVYSGNWTFDINTKTLTQDSVPSITNINNISDINVESDALQTTATFTAKDTIIKDYSPESQDILTDRYGVTLYKDDIQINDQLFMQIWNLTTGEFEISLNLSSLEKQSTYKIQVNQIDLEGRAIKEVGVFNLENN